jgi:hypothetical protein
MELTEPHQSLWPGGGQSDTAETFQVLGHAEKAQVLLPTRPLKATSQSLIRYHGGMGFGTRVARRGAATLARLGILGVLIRDRRFIDLGSTNDPGSLRSIISNAVENGSFSVAISFGPPRANQKPIIRIMNPDGRTVAFAKIGWNELTKNLVDAEVEAVSSEAVQALNSVVAPRVLFHGNWETNRVAVYQAVLGGPGRVEPDANQFLAVAHCWPTSTQKLRTTSFFERLVADLTNIEGSNGQVARGIVELLDATYGEKEFSLGGWHGDWTPWNNARLSQRRIVLWDWERAGGEAPLGFDSVHYRFQPSSLRGGRRPVAQLLNAAIRPGNSSLAGNDPEAIGRLYMATVAARHLQPGGESGPVAQYGTFLNELAAILRSDNVPSGHGNGIG